MFYKKKDSSLDNIHSMSDFKDDFVSAKHVKYQNTYLEDTAFNGTLDKGKDPEKDKKEKKNELPPVGIFSLFRYSSSYDKFLLIIGTILAIMAGGAQPGFHVIYGKLVDKLIIYDLCNKNMTNETMTTDEFLQSTTKLCVLYVVCGSVFLICNYIMVSFFSLAAANQAFKIKCMYMASILKQDIGWYDTSERDDFASQISGDLARIQDGLGEKVCIYISLIATYIIVVVTSLIFSWKLALFCLSITSLMTIAITFMSKIQASCAREEMQAYGIAGAVAEEVLSAIRIVVSFGGEKKEIERYHKCLVPARKKGIKRGLITALSESLTWVCSYLIFALTFWYGVKLVAEGDITVGILTIVMFNVKTASMFLCLAVPHLEAFTTARGAAAKIYEIIERVPKIDSSSKEGKKPDSVKGTIRIRDVYFNYPSRPSVPVLKGVSLDFQPGERVALVGSSGCGKSTIIQLLLRFYDVDQGAILLDKNNLKDLNVGWLRDHISLVGQEPVLFSTTIAENIRYGKWDATQEEIENAAKTAYIHKFIEALPLKYETLVGERGTQLSGGQKQRIAIARALVKNPRILLLDEATSALDTESESVVQAALDKASQGRTTVVVAHRLSTIRNADKIVVLSEGNVKEVGTHDELMEREGIYFNLVHAHTKYPEKEIEEMDEREQYLISEIVQKMSLLNGIAVGSAVRLRGSLPSQIASWSQLSINSCGKDCSEENFDDELDKNVSKYQVQIWKTFAKEWPFAVVGGIAALLMGFHFIAEGIMIGTVLGVLSGEPDKIKEETYVCCLIFLILAVSSGLTSFLQVFMFTVAGEKLTSRLRKMTFSNIIGQDIDFFDNPKNSVGSLCSQLTSDASSVQGVTGSMISRLFQAISTITITIILSFWYSYKIGLLVLVFIPFVFIGAYFGSREVEGQDTKDKMGTEDASKVATEAIKGIRTVASLHQEQTVFLKFRNHLKGPHKKSWKQSHLRGIVYGCAQGIFTGFGDAIFMFYGSRLIANKELQFADLVKVAETIMMTSMVIGQALAFAPEYQKAKLAAVRIFKLLAKKPKVDAFSESGKRLEEFKGCIQFEKVNFTYSSRPNVKILRDLNLKIEPGKTVALVGSSGCGKSTCVQLIERFYEPQSGSVLLDDTDVGELNVSNLRSHVGLVSQEPVLFNYSIAENIAYGDNSRHVNMHEIIEAARKSNIHNFISTLPQGYETPAGDKGTQLSGGQKQRVAIARALLRNPKILILDEATSALDAESEQLVQDALEKARRGRTCLIIAHRLTTIQKADAIMVMHEGRIVEHGTHQELLNKKGHYYKIHNKQSSAQ